jgi:hypothetical protein
VLDFQHLRTPVDDRRNPLVNSRAGGGCRIKVRRAS